MTRLRRGGGVAAGLGGMVLGGVAYFGFGDPLPVLPVLAGMLAGGAGGSLLASATDARERGKQDAALVEWVGALAADLRAGRQPVELIADRDAAHLQSPAVAAVWTVSERSGAPAAAVLDRVEQDLRTGVRHRQEISAQLAGARSTAALLAVLPLLGIGLGMAMGARPLHTLLGTGRGQVALLVGTGLDALGLLWTARIVAAAGDRR
jgi:tight adherence protein B